MASRRQFNKREITIWGAFYNLESLIFCEVSTTSLKRFLINMSGNAYASRPERRAGSESNEV
ncbi:hypothetical protein GCM10011400_64050 [Paraburkholderia caffeinilytica]|uniref:Transposase n=1 Tax=Paraburkholderia caffeinilytica TaxID=1761016 RepID=A0ABQ1NJ22_9BURK|nr:hypothetical protein GCM10011400_64050 [Paraburkholderia caffeinilytica]CAB3804189.1 hypothetical protein LMG28690_05964 [Paraburkholderia caffeinilytica]